MFSKNTNNNSLARRSSRRTTRRPSERKDLTARPQGVYTDAFYNTFQHSTPQPITIARYSASTTSFTTSTTVETNQAFYFTLDSVAGSSDFTALYDQYRILGVEIEMLPSGSDITSGSICIAPDFDDATATNLSSLLQYSKALRYPVGKPIFLKVNQPCVDVTVFGTGGAAPGVNLISPWIDCGKADVQHYGLKIAASVVGNATVYQIMIRYILQFRMIR